MLTARENEELCRVGPGTPMGTLMRSYWMPALPSREFPTGPQSPPMRMRLLGEDLVMFRGDDGSISALREACPHRGASLYFGRVDGCAIRCAYHGWKFDRDGTLLDVPTESPGTRLESHFTTTVRATAYPCHEVNKMVWIYMGPEPTPPPFPTHEVNTLPPAHVAEPNIMMEEANWLQNLEGDLDSAHLDWVHRRLERDSPPPPVGSPLFWSPQPGPPALDVSPTDYGAYYSARRSLENGSEWHRINQFIQPFHTMISSGERLLFRSFVPVDDHHAMLITQAADPVHPVTPEVNDHMVRGFDAVGGYVERTNDPRSYYMTAANKRNDYHRDLELQSDRMFVGIPFVFNLPDRAMTELMVSADGSEPIYDRTNEHLGSSDLMVSTVRKQLLTALRRQADDGSLPANVSDVEMNRVRPVTVVLPPGADWRSETAEARRVTAHKPLTAELPTVNH